MGPIGTIQNHGRDVFASDGVTGVCRVVPGFLGALAHCYFSFICLVSKLVLGSVSLLPFPPYSLSPLAATAGVAVAFRSSSLELLSLQFQIYVASLP